MGQMPRRAFHEALTEAMPAVRRFALKLTHDRERADELLQVVMLRALEKRHQFSAGTNLVAWLGQICFSQFSNEWRRAGRSVATDPILLAPLLTTKPCGPERIELREVFDALADLPPAMRNIVMLAADGCDYREISDTLGISLGTVRSRLSRSRNTLRKRCA